MILSKVCDVVKLYPGLEHASGSARWLVYHIEISKGPIRLGLSTIGDMRFLAECIIAGTHTREV